MRMAAVSMLCSKKTRSMWHFNFLVSDLAGTAVMYIVEHITVEGACLIRNLSVREELWTGESFTWARMIGGHGERLSQAMRPKRALCCGGGRERVEWVRFQEDFGGWWSWVLVIP